MIDDGMLSATELMEVQRKHREKNERALAICKLLANTPIEDWQTKASIYAALLEFRE